MDSTDEPKTGRPRLYSDELAAKVCTSIAEGRSLKKTCSLEGMPSMLTVFKWLQDETLTAFAANYARAREVQVSKFADELQDICDDASNDYTTDEEGNVVVNHENIQRSKLRIDTRKWILAKMMPKKYGDRQAIELTGKDGGPIESKVFDGEAPKLKRDELEGLVKLLERPEQPVIEINNGHNGNGATNGNGDGTH